MCLHEVARAVSVDALHERAIAVFGDEAVVGDEAVSGHGAHEVDVPLIALDDPEAVGPGTWLLVHLGFAVEILDDRTAHEMLESQRGALGPPSRTGEKARDVQPAATPGNEGTG